MKKNIKNKKGFTLLEIILSLAIFSIMFVMFLTIFSESLNQVIKMGDIGEEVYSAQSQTEMMKETDFSDTDLDNITINFGSNNMTVEGYKSQVTADDGVEINLFIPSEEDE